MKSLPLFVLFASIQVSAQTPPTEFPGDAAPLTVALLKEAFAGKEYAVKPMAGNGWSWQFKADGTFYLFSGSFSDVGKWTVEESKLCTEGRKIATSCNEIRQAGSMLYMKRDNGEVVKLSLK